MSDYKPQDPNFVARVRDSFCRQQAMATIGARLTSVEPGAVDIELAFRQELTQQHGFLHAGIVTTAIDSACGYAALSLTQPGAAVLTVEYKANFVSPAAGEKMIARGRVKKAGRTITVCDGDVYAVRGGVEKLVATMLATIMILQDRDDLTG